MTSRDAALPAANAVRKWAGVAAGAVLASVGLEMFLIPHRIVVGGLTGISALFSHFTGMRLGLFLFMFNLPFVLLGYRKVVKRYGARGIFSILLFSAGVFALHPAPMLTMNPLLASLMGGSCLGLGIGWVLRFGGFLDLSDYVVGRISQSWARYGLYGLNGALILVTGWLIGWEQSFHSLVAYVLALWWMGAGLNGSLMTRTLWIESVRAEEIVEVLQKSLNRKATPLPPESRGGEVPVVLCTVNRLEEARARALVRMIDGEAVIGVASGREPPVCDARTGRRQKK